MKYLFIFLWIFNNRKNLDLLIPIGFGIIMNHKIKCDEIYQFSK